MTLTFENVKSEKHACLYDVGCEPDCPNYIEVKVGCVTCRVIGKLPFVKNDDDSEYDQCEFNHETK